MELSAELHVPLADVWKWDADVFLDWLAFFALQDEKRKHKGKKRMG